MVTFVLQLDLNASFFHEMFGAGKMNKTELKRELKRHIKDELGEYNFDSLLDEMLSLNVPAMQSKRVIVEKG